MRCRGFDGAAFLILAKPKEGMLFPDTYYFLPGTTPRAAVQRLTDTFAQKTADIAPAIAASGHSEEEILTMASLVEREAATPEDRRIVAGILWKRIANSMRLQVDAPFGYLHGSDSYQPTAADTESDSPYNTYRHDGLPPTPIANPGLDAIDAALHPTDTPVLLLPDREGREDALREDVRRAQGEHREVSLRTAHKKARDMHRRCRVARRVVHVRMCHRTSPKRPR